MIAADPQGSVFSGGSGRPYLVEGVGEDFFRAGSEPLRRVIPISDEESFLTARRLGDRGVLIGGSGGMAVAAAIQVAAAPERTTSWWCSTRLRPRLPPGCSTTSGWPTSASPRVRPVRRAILEARPSMDELLYVNPHQTVREAIASCAPTTSARSRCARTIRRSPPPRSRAVDELSLMEVIAKDPAVLDVPVEQVMGLSCRRSVSARRSSGRSRCRSRAALLVLAGVARCRSSARRHPLVLRRSPTSNS